MLTVFAPAKINLFLAITGRRADGFHDLVSLVAPVSFGDELVVETRPAGTPYLLDCEAPGVPTDASNLVLRAANLFRDAVPDAPGARFHLTKRVPAGAGLGGGSSDGTAALLALNQLAGNPLDRREIEGLAAKLGSDCVLFLQGQPCLMRGRGERIERLPPDAQRRIAGRRILIFKPWFGISTASAYRDMAADAPASYLPPRRAEARMSDWLEDATAPLEKIVYNNMETVAFRKHRALPTLLGQLRDTFSITVGMSGSGSACFALLPDRVDVRPIEEMIRAAWGAESWLIEAAFR